MQLSFTLIWMAAIVTIMMAIHATVGVLCAGIGPHTGRNFCKRHALNKLNELLKHNCPNSPS